ncbi:hypothetical protein C8R45DRAFT_1038085 [Mycena sanguinolenta]|nr:hypothetical protein C8R45DRAFT_1038085 [Mycena sanguinolenta]
MYFLDLNYDVLLRIFTFLDAGSIIRCAEVRGSVWRFSRLLLPFSPSQVCSAFRKLAQSKHIWLAVVHKLGHRNLLFLPPRDILLGYSAPQLIEEVKRAVFGPRTWATTSSRPPTVRGQIHVAISGAPASPLCEPTLLLGDRHLLVNRGPGCEIWDVVDNRQVWVGDVVVRSQMLAHPIQNGAELLIGLWSGRPPLWARMPTQLDGKIVAQFIVLDLKTNFETSLPRIQLSRNFTMFSNVVAADDFWTADVEWYYPRGAGWYGGILIVNWRDHTFVLQNGTLVHKKLLPGHLLGLTDVAEESDVVLYPLTAFNPHWQPLNTANIAKASQSSLRIKPFVLQRVEYPILPGYRTPLMSVHDCPLNQGSYVVSTHTASTETLPADIEARGLPSQHRYRLTLPTSNSPTRWEKISSGGAINQVFMQSLTYCGYGVAIFSGRRQPATQTICRPATGEGAQDGTSVVPLPVRNFGDACLSPDTCAITVCSADGADVYYYE